MKDAPRDSGVLVERKCQQVPQRLRHLRPVVIRQPAKRVLPLPAEQNGAPHDQGGPGNENAALGGELMIEIGRRLTIAAISSTV